jgi:hypothetical protein
VSHEDGLDFVVEGTGTATCPYFPVVDHNISIEKTAKVSTLSVESMTLASSTVQWCEQSSALLGVLTSLLAAFPLF